jgi:hypothetical protein
MTCLETALPAYLERNLIFIPFPPLRARVKVRGKESRFSPSGIINLYKPMRLNPGYPGEP